VIRLPALISSCCSRTYYAHPPRAVCITLWIYTRDRNSGWHYCFTFRRFGVPVSAGRLEILTGCRGFSQLPHANIPHIRPRVFPSTSLPVQYSLIILPYDCTVCTATSVVKQTVNYNVSPCSSAQFCTQYTPHTHKIVSNKLGLIFLFLLYLPNVNILINQYLNLQHAATLPKWTDNLLKILSILMF
jgi:hypothetical protein